MNVHFSRTSAHHGLLLDQGGHGAAAAPNQTIVLGVRDGLRVEILGGVSFLGGEVLVVVLLLLLVVVLVVLFALLLLLLSFLLLLKLATAAAALLLLVRPHLFPFPPFSLHVRPQIVLR